MTEQSVEGRTRAGPDNFGLLQDASVLAIVQTYPVEETVPTGNLAA